MEHVIIKKVTLDELETLQLISKKTFRETFTLQNSYADMEKYLAEELNLEKLSVELNNNESEFYFAIWNDEVVGYIKINVGDAQTEFKDPNSLEIERIYVLKTFQGKQIGQVLFNHALDIANKKEMDYLWLGVWEENIKAINFYKKNGLAIFSSHIFKLGNDVQTDVLMKLHL